MEGILLRSSGIQPSSVSKGAPRISIYLFRAGGGGGSAAGFVGDHPSRGPLTQRAAEFRGKFLFRLPQRRARSLAFYCIAASLTIIDIRRKQL